jgi:hypothetical protein
MLDVITPFVHRWMQLGDPNGIYRRALAAFPDQAMVKRYMDKVRLLWFGLLADVSFAFAWR